MADQRDGSPDYHAAAYQGLSGRTAGRTCDWNKFPGSGSQGLVGDGAGMFLAGELRTKGIEEVGSLSVGKQSLAAVLMAELEGMGKTYRMRLRDTGR